MTDAKAAILFDTAVAHQHAGRLADALILFEALAGQYPKIAEVHISCGAVLLALARYDEAIEAFDSALALAPASFDAHWGKSAAYERLQRPEDALTSSDRAIEIQPGFALAHNNRAIALKELKRLDDAIASYDRAIILMPQFPESYWGKSLCLLLLGRFKEGWLLYEWRKRLPQAERTSDAVPYWSGAESLEGMTLLIHAEQGLGDTIQFCRYAVLVQNKGAEIALRVPDELVRLLKNLGDRITVIGESQPVPCHHYRIHLLSLPLAFGTYLANIPRHVPYIRAEPPAVALWKDKIGGRGFKIGIVWHGGDPRKEADPSRFFALRYLEPISKLPGVRLISLQKNEGVEQLHQLADGMVVETLANLDGGTDAFVDTAVVMECLDLIITPDTAIAHLAGALGRPVWLALRYVPDWRWLLDREDSPWYPTMRLFRQPLRDDWPSVFAAMAAQLIDAMEDA
jgi:tetratricopeptide (TPR) repeat protein